MQQYGSGAQSPSSSNVTLPSLQYQTQQQQQQAPTAQRLGFTPASGPSMSMVDIVISARDLYAIHGDPNPFCVLYVRSHGVQEWTEAGRSETKAFTRSPKFEARFAVAFHFELYQEVRVAIFDRENESDALSRQTLLGLADVPLASFLRTPVDFDLTNIKLNPTGSVGVVTLRALKSEKGSRVFTFKWTVMGLPLHAFPRLYNEKLAAGVLPQGSIQGPEGAKAHYFGGKSAKPQPLPDDLPPDAIEGVQLAFYRGDPTGATWEAVAFSSFCPAYADQGEGMHVTVNASAEALSQNDESRLIRIMVRRTWRAKHVVKEAEQAAAVSKSMVPSGWVSFSDHGAQEENPDKLQPSNTGLKTTFSFIGNVDSSYSALQILQPGAPLSVVGPFGGILRFDEKSERDMSFFFDHISRGMVDISLIAAIDFTSSNGDPKSPNSLHYVHPDGRPNFYEAAVRSIFNILAPHVSDKKIPAYGFGADLPPEWKTSHCFALTGNPYDPFCDGVENVLSAYRNALSAVRLYGPTVLSNVLKTSAIIVSRKLSQGGPVPYHVLLVITDGALSDVDTSVAELVRASVLPLSVIIIGVGREDFSKMRPFMDYDPDQGVEPAIEPRRKPLLRSEERVALRDNVQFVAMRDFRGDLAKLAAKVLALIPIQIMSYFDLQSKSNSQHMPMMNMPMGPR